MHQGQNPRPSSVSFNQPLFCVLILIELPYPDQVGGLFAPLAETPWAMWLDSGHPAVADGRSDMLVAFPRVTLVAQGGLVHIQEEDGGARDVSEGPLAVLAQYLSTTSCEECAGGAVGYFSYDLIRQYVTLPEVARDEDRIPDMAVGIYDGFVHVDHMNKRCQIRAQDTDAGRSWARRMEEVLTHVQKTPPTDFAVLDEVRSNLDFAAYAKAFSTVQDYIRAGDCYQINLAMRLSAPCNGHPWSLYMALRERNPAPYAAWMNFPFGQVLSSSPESFLSLHAGQVTTRPIKGTRPRGRDFLEDERQCAELAASAKDQAENLMIVDLLRNDLGKVCSPGSIEVPELFHVESYATVHHLVSTVTGRLAPDRTAVDLLAAAFPGGSITGAPKQRAMEIIESLEPHRRGVYCGAIGYLGLDGGMELNIAIRTLVCSNGQIRYWAGGGLVADSDVCGEYQECLDKGRAMQEVLDAFKSHAGDGGQIP